MSDMSTCPVPELVEQFRKTAKKAGEENDFIRAMVFNIVAARFEKMDDRIDILEKTLERLGNDVEAEVEATQELSDGSN